LLVLKFVFDAQSAPCGSPRPLGPVMYWAGPRTGDTVRSWLRLITVKEHRAESVKGNTKEAKTRDTRQECPLFPPCAVTQDTMDSSRQAL
jgi:hypothetical protein